MHTRTQRRYVSVLLCCACSVLFSFCAALPPPPEKPAIQAESEESDTTPQTAMVKKVIRLVLREQTYFKEGGTPEKIRVYIYEDGSDRLTREELFSGGGKLLESIDYIYSEGLLTKKLFRDESGRTTGSRDYRYTPGGLLEEETVMGSREEIQTVSRYLYNEAGQRVRWDLINSQRNLISYSVYSYKNGNILRIDNYNPGGMVEEYFIFEYTEGKRIKTSEYNAGKRLVRFTAFLYTEDLLTAEEYYNASGVLQRKVVYQRDAAGEITAFIHTDSRGIIREKVEREYFELEVFSPEI